jgi:hypothetical protein
MRGYIWAGAAVLLLVVTATVIVIVNQNRKLNQLHDDLRTINDSQKKAAPEVWIGSPEAFQHRQWKHALSGK